MNEEQNSNNAETQQLNIAGVSGCFYLLSEIKPPKNGRYEVITSRGRVVEINYESFLGNDILEAKYELQQMKRDIEIEKYYYEPEIFEEKITEMQLTIFD